MIVACPHCAAVYEMPKHLLGPGGASVRCPHCAGEFLLGAGGDVTAIGPGGERPRGAESQGRAREGRATGAAVRAPDPATAATRTAVAPRGTEPSTGSARAGGAPRAPDGTASGAPARASAEPGTGADSGAEAEAVARRVLDELAARKGPAMADASGRGRLLSEFGPELVAAYDEYRKQSGGSGNPGPFRDALRERWGIDLTPPPRG